MRRSKIHAKTQHDRQSDTYHEQSEYAFSHTFKHHYQKLSWTDEHDWSDLYHTRNQMSNHELWNWLKAWEWFWSLLNYYMSVSQSWHADDEAEKTLKKHEHEWDSDKCSTFSNAQSFWESRRDWQIHRLSDKVYKTSCRWHDAVNQVSSRTHMFMMNIWNWEVCLTDSSST